MSDGTASVNRKMPRFIRAYVRVVDKMGYAAGLVAMLLTFVLMGFLVESTAARGLFGTTHVWSVEMAQFIMAAYYLLGGALSEQDDYHVRMDLVYSRFKPRTRAFIDLFTAPILIFYVGFLFTGAIGSTQWAVINRQVNYSPWAPLMWPIKSIMALGIGLMLAQIIALYFRDLATVLGRSITDKVPAPQTPPPVGTAAEAVEGGGR